MDKKKRSTHRDRRKSGGGAATKDAKERSRKMLSLFGEDATVVKHSAAVHVSNRISLLQRKGWNTLLWNAYRELPNPSIATHSMSYKDFKDAIRTTTRDKKYMRTQLRGLMTQPVEFNVLRTDAEEDWEATTLLASVAIRGDTIYYEFSDLLRKKLYRPDVYARISLSMQSRFNSKHALAIYELAVDYFIARRGFGETPAIDLEKFRFLLGFKDDEYKQFKDLNRDVIKPAIREINELSDLYVEVELHRTGRTVAALKLYVTPNPNNTNPLLIESQNPSFSGEPASEASPVVFDEKLYKLYDRLQQEYKLTRNQAQDVLQQYDLAQIRHNLAFVDLELKRSRDGKRKKPIDSLGAFTMFAIRENKQPQLNLFPDTPPGATPAKRPTASATAEERLWDAYQDYVDAALTQCRAQLSESQLHALEEEADTLLAQDGIHKGRHPTYDWELKCRVQMLLKQEGDVLDFNEWKGQHAQGVADTEGL